MGSNGSVIPFFKNLKKSGSLPITHPEMTRFNISLEDGCEMVFYAIDKAWGGEIFIPKIPSYRLIDVATAIAPEMEKKVVGIRPGEKMHEIMCPKDDSHLTLEFDKHYTIKPSFTFEDATVDYSVTLLGEKGTAVSSGFEYNSETNHYFLSIKEIQSINKMVLKIPN